MNECSEWMPVDENNKEDNKQLFDGIRYRGKFSKIPGAAFNLNAHKASLKNEQEYLLTCVVSVMDWLIAPKKFHARSICLAALHRPALCT